MTDQNYPTTPSNEIETRKGKTYVFIDPGTTFNDLPRIHRTVVEHYHKYGFANCLQLGDGSKRTFGDGQPYTVPDDGKHYHWLELEDAIVVFDELDTSPAESRELLYNRWRAAMDRIMSEDTPTPVTDPDDLLPATDAEAEVLAAANELGKSLVKAMRTKEGGES